MGLPMRTFYDEMAEITIDDVKQMTTSELVSYLEQQINISLNTEFFARNKIDGTVLYYTRQDELQSLGLPFGYAKRITIFIEDLKKKGITQGTAINYV